MVKVRNQFSVFTAVLIAACLTAPSLATLRSHELAQAIDNPDAVDNPDAGELPPTGESLPPDLTPSFDPSETLPEEANLTIEGSSSMSVITDSLARAFQQSYPNASVTLTERPSEIALQNLLAGTADLAAIGRSLTDEQLAQGLAEVPISREKVAIIVGADNPFDQQLQAEDFVRIFRGEITNWMELGGPDLPIRLIDRPDTSDTRAALADYEIFGGDLTTGPNAVRVPNDSTAEVVEALGDNGIGYAIASQVIGQENVRVLSMHNTLPDDPRYPYSQPRNYVYRSTEEVPAEVQAFLALATNAEGQAAVSQAKAAEAADVAAADLPDTVVAMRPNGQGFVTGDRSGRLNFWNVDGTSAGEPVAAHTGPVTAAAFSNDGQRLISGGADGTIRLWDAVGNAIGDPINGGNGPITNLVVQPDGSFISASSDGVIQRWDNLGNPVGTPITGHTEAVRDMTLSPDGSTLITASKDGTIRRWNLADGTPLGEPLTGHQGAVQTVAMKPDGSFFSGGADGTVRRWDASGNPIGNPLQVAGPVNEIATNAEGTTVAVGDDTGSLQYLSGEGVPIGEAINDVGAPIDDLAFTPEGDRLIVSTGEAPQLRDSTGQLIPIPQGEEVGTVTTPNIPPELMDLWQQIKALPPQVLWLIPLALLALLLLGLLRSFRKDEKDHLQDEDVVGLLPPEENASVNTVTGEDFAPDTSAPVSGFMPQEAGQSVDTSLAKAKQTLAQGVSLEQAGQYQAALDHFNKAIELADIERLKALAAGTTLAGAGAVIARGLARRGTALAKLDRTDEALKSLNRALEMDPNDVEAWIGKGNLLAQMGQVDEAIFCFDKAIELNPNLASAWEGKGKALQKMGRDAEARNCLNKAISLGSGGEESPYYSETPIIVPPPSSEDTGFSVTPGVPPMRPPSKPEIQPGPIPPTGRPIQPGSIPDVPPYINGPGPNHMPEPPLPPVEGPIGPIGIKPPEPTVYPGNLGDISPELLSVIDNLPPDPNAPQLSGTLPPETSQPVIEPLDLVETPETAVPPEVLETVEKLPDTPEEPDPEAPLTPPDEIPPEVSAILSGTSDIPAEEEPASLVGVKDPMAQFFGNDPTASMRPPAGGDRTGTPTTRSPESPQISAKPSEPSIVDTAARPDIPPEEDMDLTGLPPDIIEALRGIPEDSPDSFNLPPASSNRPVPPPPPANPRIKDGPV